ncbi:hypothetical protein F0L74_20095 [Chitinophaga agrisoli]|uniref:Uncharacterized protein n=1 Tax=Chitinophaga agrisoli TaxID=2607653 RepID=A0A5B2VIQ9_9BACT|nr:hypothetical protein [Chitinophaga agrisoli]KAA2238528.1 hypothetical protein F0L74_20095 [Chitinophaga agrisoli]
MNDLLALTIAAHGGLPRWEQFDNISARLLVGGVTWPMKGHPGVMDDLHVTVDLKKEWASHSPFIQTDWHTVFEPGRVAIEDANGTVVEELANPRASFKGHTVETPWTRLQLAYFAGYAMWTYFNAPFNFIQPGYEVSELELWEENGETWRRLRVQFPENVATHGAVQVFYIDKTGLIRRHDYDVDVLGGASAVHYTDDYVDVNGIKIATKRRVYVRKEDNTPLLPEPLLVSVDLKEIELR